MKAANKSGKQAHAAAIVHPATPRAPVLPDVLAPGLKVVFCGTAPSRRSASEQAYYAHPGNRFWPALHQSQLTPERLAAHQFRLLLQWGMGLTDLAKHHCGNDSQLPTDAFDVPALAKKMHRYAPAILAFTSKQAARTALGRPAAKPLDYGLQAQAFENCQVFVLPSPSGQARGHWDLAPWQALKRHLHSLNLP